MKLLDRLIPKYTRLPLIGSLLINMLAYYASQLISGALPHFVLSTPLDALIPFWSPAIVFYVISYPFWVVGFIIFARENREVCYRMLAAEQIAKLLCLLFFLFLPCTMERAADTGGGFFGWLTDLIYASDKPTNLFPSIHCMDSWICFRGALLCRKPGRWYAPFCLVLSVFIFASTVLVKQHVVVDIPAGVAAAEIGILLARKCGADRLYRKMEDFLTSRKRRSA